jgi:excisionase family DNA binding protein
MHAHLALNVPAAAKALSISRTTIERLIASGDLPAFKAHNGPRGRRISVRAIEEYMAKKTFNDIGKHSL